MSSSENTGMAAITHILALFTWVLGPLLILVVTEDEFVKENAKNAINWQIFFAIYMIISMVLMLVLIGFLLALLVALLDLVFCILAAVKASDREAWSYPLTLDLL